MYEGDHKHGYTGRHMNRSGGFTLLELMVTVAVAGVLMTVAIPAYQGMVERNTMTSVINDLVGDINYARSEAVTRGAPVFLCPSNDASTCSGTGLWKEGWIVKATSDPSGDNLLRVHSAITLPTVDIKKNTVGAKISFNGSGFANEGAGTLALGEQGTDDQNTACVVISLSGRVRTVTGYYGADASDCQPNPQGTT